MLGERRHCCSPQVRPSPVSIAANTRSHSGIPPTPSTPAASIMPLQCAVWGVDASSHGSLFRAQAPWIFFAIKLLFAVDVGAVRYEYIFSMVGLLPIPGC